jgi:ABC-type multidrug transport system permease subunit
MWRDVINIRRNPIILTSRIIQTIILSLITGALFWKLGNDYSAAGLSKSFNSKNGALFFLSISNFMSAMSPVILTFPLEKAVFLKEQSNKMYSVFSYFLSRNLVELPILLIAPLLNAVIVYWMIKLHTGGSYFLLFFTISFLTGLAGNSVGLFVSSFFNDAKVASGMLPLIVLPLMLFSGFYKNRKDLPGWIGWI